MKIKDIVQSLKSFAANKRERFEEAKRQKDEKKLIADGISLLPLSADDGLFDKDTAGFSVYCECLEKALKDPRIFNIAVTGGFGVGKSSIIRSYDKQKNRHPKFLYISLGKYDDNSSEATEKVLERRLLLQIYAHCKNADIPEGSYQKIPEPSGIKTLIKTLLVSVFGGLLAASALDFWVFDKQESFMLAGIIKIYNDYFDILFLTIAGLIAFFVGKLYKQIRTKSVTLKTEHIEAEIAENDNKSNNSNNSYIDQHASEFVYCLLRIGRKIGYTVVFEDLDRIKPEVSIQILTRLRELNYLVNLRSPKKKPIRFVYAVNDDIIGKLKYTKFFDYIMPVLPSNTKKSAVDILNKQLNKINDYLKAYIKKKHRIDLTDIQVTLLENIAPYLTDYRLVYTILNDYVLLMRLYYTNSGSNKIDVVPDKILAFAVYKNWCPQDYHNLMESGKSNVFPDYDRDTFRNTKKKLLDILDAGKYLSLDTLYCVGYPVKEIDKHSQTIKAHYLKIWEDAFAANNEKACQDVKKMTITEYCLPMVDELKKKRNELLIEINQNWDKTRNALDLLYREPETIELLYLIRALDSCDISTGWMFEVSYVNIVLMLLQVLQDTDTEVYDSIIKKSIGMLDKCVDGSSNFFNKRADLNEDEKRIAQLLAFHGW